MAHSRAAHVLAASGMTKAQKVLRVLAEGPSPHRPATTSASAASLVAARGGSTSGTVSTYEVFQKRRRPTCSACGSARVTPSERGAIQAQLDEAEMIGVFYR